jgi:hypothetical protein
MVAEQARTRPIFLKEIRRCGHLVDGIVGVAELGRNLSGI